MDQRLTMRARAESMTGETQSAERNVFRDCSTEPPTQEVQQACPLCPAHNPKEPESTPAPSPSSEGRAAGQHGVRRRGWGLGVPLPPGRICPL